MLELNSPAVFWNGSAATGAEIDRVLAHYNSPVRGQGETIARVARMEGVNPVLLLAVMQQETGFGRAPGHAQRAEWVGNPFATHLNPRAKGIAKLRSPTGEVATFEQSLRAMIRELKMAAQASPTPLTTAGVKLRPNQPGWALEVDGHYRTQAQRILRSR